MPLPTQGTKVYLKDPLTDQLLQIDCPTGLTIPSAESEQLDATCLDDLDRHFRAGLGNPGVVSLTLNFDPGSASHVRLVQLKKSRENVTWVVGLSDGTTAPALDSAGELDLPTDRSFVSFEGYVSAVPIDAQLNAFYTMEVSVQMSGDYDLYPKTP